MPKRRLPPWIAQQQAAERRSKAGEAARHGKAVSEIDVPPAPTWTREEIEEMRRKVKGTACRTSSDARS